MAKITDPSLLAQATEVVFDTTAKTIQLLVAGDLSTDGVTLQALYSFCKEQWKTDAELIKYPFPLVAITEQKFDVVNGWDFEDATTRNLIRDAGWALKDALNVSQEEYMGFVTLGTVGALHQIYYQQSEGGSSTDVVLTGAANQAVKIYGDVTHGDFDYRSYFKCFVREQAFLYDQSELADIGRDTVTYQVYSFPLGNGDDLKVTHLDAAIAADAPYTGMSITYLAGTGFAAYNAGTTYALNTVVSNAGRWWICIQAGGSGHTPADDTWWDPYLGERQLGSSYFAFNVIVDGNAGNTRQAYEFVQYKLRQNSDIDAGSGSVIGKTANSLLSFVGDTLVTASGVFLDDFALADKNSVDFYDVLGAKQTYPYLASGTITFNENLVNDTGGKYWMFFTRTDLSNTHDFGTTDALIVDDGSSVPLTADINASSINFTFDYENNIQGGRTPNVDAEVTIVGIGLETGQYVKTTGTIARSNANAFSLVSSLERNYTA